MAVAPLSHSVRGTGPDLVLLHPVGLDGSTWQAVGDVLARSRRIIAVDLPGHGGSPLRRTMQGIEDYADDVLALIAGLGLGAYALGGLSFGGMIAQTLAVRRPAGLDALIVCGCPATFPEEARSVVRERGQKALREGMAAVVEETLARWLTEDFIRAGKAEPVRRHLLAVDPAAWASAWTAIGTHDAKPRLGAVDVPTLCIAGEHDLGSPPAAVRAVAEAIPNAAYAEIPGAPHMMQIERPAEMAALMAEFLGMRGG